MPYPITGTAICLTEINLTSFPYMFQTPAEADKEDTDIMVQTISAYTMGIMMIPVTQQTICLISVLLTA